MSLSNLGLDAFVAVSKHGTVLEASKHLGVTQTAVTQRLRSLEREIRTTLFIRSRKGMKLTDSGVKLLTYCKQREALESEVVSNIINEGVSGPIRLSIAGSTYFMMSRILSILTKIQKQYPNIFFNFDINDDDDKLSKLKSGKVDFTFLPRDRVPLELDSKLLKKSKYVLVGGERYRKLTEVPTLIDYSPLDNFTSMFFEEHSLDYEKGRDRHFINNTMMLPKLLENNLGVAVLDYEHFKQVKKQYRVYNLYPNKYYEIEWALVWLARAELPDYFKFILNSIK